MKTKKLYIVKLTNRGFCANSSGYIVEKGNPSPDIKKAKIFKQKARAIKAGEREYIEATLIEITINNNGKRKIISSTLIKEDSGRNQYVRAGYDDCAINEVVRKAREWERNHGIYVDY